MGQAPRSSESVFGHRCEKTKEPRSYTSSSFRTSSRTSGLWISAHGVPMHKPLYAVCHSPYSAGTFSALMSLDDLQDTQAFQISYTEPTERDGVLDDWCAISIAQEIELLR